MIIMNYLMDVKTVTDSYVDDDSASVIIMDQNSNNMAEFNDYFGSNRDNFSDLDMGDEIQFVFTPETIINLTTFIMMADNATVKSEVGFRDPLAIILPITFIYVVIFVAGVLGNVITCVVIYKNKTMHTATNYYLFNLAVSDFLVLMTGMPVDLYNIWFPSAFPFSETVCILQGLFSETSTNATILTITSFTCERYIAICHVLRSHTMSKLSRVVRFIFIIWMLAFALAMPQALQFGTIELRNGGISCTVKNQIFEHSFEVSSFLFFIVPMTVICVLYILIGLKLRKSKMLYDNKGKGGDSQRCIKGQTRVVRMLIAVVVSFFLCFAPFHSQRIMAIYGKATKKSFSTEDMFMKVYIGLTYISGVTYFLSTCINPFLYNLMSHKFRNASKLTLFVHCFNRTPSTKKTPLGTNYSALTLKFGPLDAARMTSMNRDQFSLPSANNSSSEILEIKEVASIDEVRNFRTDGGVPFMMDQPYHAVVRFEPMSYSYSQHTTTTTISRDNSLKLRKENGSEGATLNSLAKKLKNCTKKAFVFKNSDENERAQQQQVVEVVCAGIIPDVNPSLREIDEDAIDSPRVTPDDFNLMNPSNFYKIDSSS